MRGNDDRIIAIALARNMLHAILLYAICAMLSGLGYDGRRSFDYDQEDRNNKKSQWKELN